MDQQNPVEILIIDNANKLRDVLESFLQQQSSIHLIGSVTRVKDAFRLAGNESLQVILLGVRGTTRSDVIYLRRKLPQAAILLLGSLECKGTNAVASYVGADSYINKDDLVEKLVPEIIRLAQGQNADHQRVF